MSRMRSRWNAIQRTTETLAEIEREILLFLKVFARDLMNKSETEKRESLRVFRFIEHRTRSANVNIQRIIEQFIKFFSFYEQPKLLNCLYIAQDVAIKEVLMWMFTKMFTQLCSLYRLFSLLCFSVAFFMCCLMTKF